jgi:hypothetical protein
MRLQFIALACLINVIGIGQSWEQTYPSTMWSSISIDQTTDGGFITGKVTESEGACLLKINNLGQEEWSLTLPDPEVSFFRGIHIEVSTNGDFICCYIGDNNIFKVSIDGTLISTSNLPIATESMCKTNDGKIIIIGENGMTKINDSLEILWYQVYSPELLLTSVYPLSNDGFVIYGDINMSENWWDQELILMKTDAFGNEEWSQTYGGGAAFDWPGDKIIQLYDNSIVFISGYDSNLNSDIIRIDENGQELWIAQDDLKVFNSLARTSDNGLVAVGYLSSIEPFWDWNGNLTVSKYDINGNQDWEQTFGGENTDWGHYVNQTSDNGYIISGLKEIIHESEYEQYLIKLDSEGILSSSFTIPTSSPRKLEKVVDALGREINHTTNQILFLIYDDGSVEKKFVVEGFQ